MIGAGVACEMCVDESSALVIGGRNAKRFLWKVWAQQVHHNINLFSLVFPVQCHPFVHNIIRPVDIINFCSCLYESKW